MNATAQNTQSKHTAGPWKILPDEFASKNPYGKTRFIATHDATWSGDSPQSDDYLVSGSLICAMRDGPEANAHLITAAPELLASLAWAISYFDDPNRVLDSRELNKARAALAKATA